MINITITGTAGSGKSTIAFLIQEMLENKGVIVNHEDPDGESPIFLNEKIKSVGEVVIEQHQSVVKL